MRNAPPAVQSWGRERTRALKEARRRTAARGTRDLVNRVRLLWWLGFEDYRAGLLIGEIDTGCRKGGQQDGGTMLGGAPTAAATVAIWRKHPLLLLLLDRRLHLKYMDADGMVWR